ncbi:hypothetical protein [Neopusillimonas aromaticivorans]|uniref:hypothetical protein n=1 Tax=Neopusillimonas aromaticivorans TaxID=2979868 RepID=UPI0025991914|nr:hypothetical protein [Neopusillimonas aromaticivorans]WJJ93955.1 hypothetical protein N7E01_01845 [Neopusillimonas aromaticivorans]
MIKLFTTLLGVAAATGSVHATEFSCDIANKSRSVTLTQSDQTVSYTYGKKGAAPELALTVPVSAIELYAWEGMGRHQTYSIGIPNGQYLYTVYTSMDSLEQATSAGVTIEKGGKYLAELLCNPNTVNGDLEQMVLGLKTDGTARQ